MKYMTQTEAEQISQLVCPEYQHRIGLPLETDAVLYFC
jgi:hypothetical protein